jgi:putative membrane protein
MTHAMAVAAVSVPLLAACGTRDTTARNDSGGGTVAMADSSSVSRTTSEAAGAMDAGLAAFVVAVNQTEIEAGHLATTKARNGDVKEYARDMASDHEKALGELHALSTKNSWPMPDSAGTTAGTNSAMAATITQVQQSHQAAMTKLRSTTGAAFDRAYIEGQVAAHQQALDVLRQQASSLQNTELRDKVTDMQKAIEDHLKRAQAIAQKLGPSSP